MGSHGEWTNPSGLPGRRLLSLLFSQGIPAFISTPITSWYIGKEEDNYLISDPVMENTTTLTSYELGRVRFPAKGALAPQGNSCIIHKPAAASHRAGRSRQSIKRRYSKEYTQYAAYPRPYRRRQRHTIYRQKNKKMAPDKLGLKTGRPVPGATGTHAGRDRNRAAAAAGIFMAPFCRRRMPGIRPTPFLRISPTPIHHRSSRHVARGRRTRLRYLQGQFAGQPGGF